MNVLHRGGPAAIPTSQELLALGVEDVAYVRPAEGDGQTHWTIHNAAGQEIGQAPSRDLAFAAIIQHEMEPASVH
ncbi:DUF1150 family protein [Novispirillum sp. DQ9]|uniref:DUF1150 family protein n=1 Tax=Novispirillum sp. DQ9 TaxID=3398612 RepID=UPI003C7A9A46